MTEPEFNLERAKCLFCKQWINLEAGNHVILDQENPYVRQFGLQSAHAHNLCVEEMPDDPQRAEEEGWSFEGYVIDGTTNETLLFGTADNNFNTDINSFEINAPELNINSNTVNIPDNTTINLGNSLYITTNSFITMASGTTGYTGNFNINVNGRSPDANRFSGHNVSSINWNHLTLLLEAEDISAYSDGDRIAIFTKDEIQRFIANYTQKPKGIKAKIKRFLQKLIIKLFI